MKNVFIFNFQFDQYVRSLSIDPDSPSFRLVTDGPLPLRQCLHPEACAKDIELPSYYCRYSDLKKEFVKCKSSTTPDLSRALIPVKDVSKLPNMPMPTVSLSHCIADMIKGKTNNINNLLTRLTMVSRVLHFVDLFPHFKLIQTTYQLYEIILLYYIWSVHVYFFIAII